MTVPETPAVPACEMGAAVKPMTATEMTAAAVAAATVTAAMTTTAMSPSLCGHVSDGHHQSGRPNGCQAIRPRQDAPGQ